MSEDGRPRCTKYVHIKIDDIGCQCGHIREADGGGRVPPHPAEFCICAAVIFADGRIVRGHRHDSCFLTAGRWTPQPDLKGSVQGFITSQNRFVGREEGAQLQKAAGFGVSAHTQSEIGDELFSEDLYFDTHDHVAWNAPYQESAAPLPAPEVKEPHGNGQRENSEGNGDASRETAEPSGARREDAAIADGGQVPIGSDAAGRERASTRGDNRQESVSGDSTRAIVRQAEMTSEGSGGPVVRSATDVEVLAGVMKKLLPPELLEYVLTYLDPLGAFEEALRVVNNDVVGMARDVAQVYVSARDNSRDACESEAVWRAKAEHAEATLQAVRDYVTELQARATTLSATMRQYTYGGEKDGDILDEVIERNFAKAHVWREEAAKLAALTVVQTPPQETQ